MSLMYDELPPIGTPDDDGALATWCNGLVQEAQGVRAMYIADLDKCLNLYLHGRETGPDPARTTVNKVQAIIHTFVDLAVKTPPVPSLEPSCVGDNPEWYLLDEVEGIDISQPIPPAMLTAAGPDGLPVIPEQARIAITNDLVAEFEQTIFDVQYDRARANQFFRTNVWLTNLYGWQFGLYEWDDADKKHILSNPPLLQWFPDSTVDDVKDMAFIAFDWPMDANLARRKYPELADKIDDAASENPQRLVSADSYSEVYTQPTYRRGIVTVREMWIRNMPCRYQPDQAAAKGLVNVQQVPDETQMPEQPGLLQRVVTAVKGALGGGGGEPAGEAAGGVQTPAAPPPTRDAYMHPDTGEEITPEHSDWPTYPCNRRVTLIQDVVVSDMVCETWDFPIVHNVNIPIPNRPFGQGEPIRVRSLQAALNSMQDAMVKHAQWFKGPAGVGDVAVQEQLPEGFKDAHMTPDTLWWIDSQVMKDSGGKPVQYYDPPELPPALTTVKRDLEHELDGVSGVVPVLQGDAPAQWSGAAMENQQAAATSAASVKGLRFEEVVYRLSRLMLHSNLTRMSAEDCYKINNKYPLHIVRAIHERRAQQMDWDIKVEVGSGAGQQKAQKEAKVLDWLKMGLIDMESARDMLGLDHKLIEQRMNSQQQKAMAAQGSPAPIQ